MWPSEHTVANEFVKVYHDGEVFVMKLNTSNPGLYSNISSKWIYVYEMLLIIGRYIQNKQFPRNDPEFCEKLNLMWDLTDFLYVLVV